MLSAHPLPAPPPRPASSRTQLVIFDFDGTLSWLRHGWPEMMSAAALPHFPEAAVRSEKGLRSLILDEILARNGQPSIRQCERLSEMIVARGGVSPAPEALRRTFQEALDAAILRRSERVTSGARAPEDYLIRGTRAFLEALAPLGLTLAVVSSTLESRVRAEAELLGVAHFFGDRIYGGAADAAAFSKARVFEQLLAEQNLPGAALLAFGDGPTEIAEAVRLGGTAVAVCTDEERRHSGALDERKRRLLVSAGASAALPDFQDAGALAALFV